MRDAARDKLEAEPDRMELDTREKLSAFFERCDALEEGRGPEPEWDEHLQVIEASRRSGVTDT
ncbi:MAG: hypothetical protein ACREMK_10150 [Gemmatimonadota bacterium]